MWITAFVFKGAENFLFNEQKSFLGTFVFLELLFSFSLTVS